MSRSRIAALLLPVAGLFLLPCLLAAAQAEPAQKGKSTATGKLSAIALAERIDKHISERWKKEGIQPVGPADGATLVRRLHLDLAGKIPTIIDITDALSKDGPTKGEFIDKFLNGESYPDHFASVYRSMILSNIENEQTIFLIGGFDNWLRKKFNENTRYDKMVHELLTSNPQQNNFGGGPGDFNNASPAAFYAANEYKPENLAGATARLFLGVKIECAQCHKHPFADWTHKEFWQFAAFFVNANPNGPMATPIEDIKDGQAQLSQPKDANEGPRIAIPKTDPVQYAKAKFLDGTAPKWQAGMDPRKALADWIVSPENPYFAKMAVNYVWGYFFGVGLVDPIDDLGKHNPASHPELLDEMADQFVRHGYDLKYLMKAITNSKIYQLSSAPLPQKFKGEEEQDLNRLFARMPLRALSGEQLFDSLAHVMEYPFDKSRSAVPGIGLTPRQEFLSKFANPENRRIDTHTSILQALQLMNGKFMANATSVERNPNLATIAKMNAPNKKRIEELYLLTLSRMPQPDELKRLTNYIALGGRRGDRDQMLADILWALLNSPEFALNH